MPADGRRIDAVQCIAVVMDVVTIIQMVCSFVLGGGLSTMLTIRTVRHNHRRDAELADFKALREIIEGQGIEIVDMRKRMNEQAAIWQTACNQCSYRAFYLDQEKRLNERISARAE